MARSNPERQEPHEIVKRLLGNPSLLGSDIRREMAKSLDLVPREDIHKAALAESLEKKQYPRMVKALGKYKVPLKNIPSAEVMKDALTPRILEIALQLQNPILLVIPKLTRRQLLRLWNNYYELPLLDPKRTFDWSQSVYEKNIWEVDIVEGSRDIDSEEEMKKEYKRVNGRETHYDYVKFLYEENCRLGFRTFSGARRYIALNMRLAEDGQMVDKWSSTVLNAPWLASTTPLAMATCNHDDHRLSFISANIHETLDTEQLHVRRSIHIPL